MPQEVSPPLYNHFNQVKSIIQGVMPIDYFFAKEMMSALTCNVIGKVPEKVTDQVSDKLTDSDTDTYSYPDRQSNLYHLFLALSASLRSGHSCLPLTEVSSQHWGKGFAVSSKDSDIKSTDNKENTVHQEASGNSNETLNEPLSELSHPGFIFSSLTQLQDMLSEVNIQPSDQQLVVLEHDKLYMRRYFQFETDLGKAIHGRLLQECQYDDDNIRECIEALFPTRDDSKNDEASSENKDIELLEIDWQKVAVANAINKNFSVIAGGPGTGKTYTVTKLLAALVNLEQVRLEKSNGESYREQGTPVLNIALVAPTGKAAQRLSESIVDAIAGFKGLIDDKVLADIPTQAQTLHRLLGVIPNSPNFRHHENNRLSYDIVLIDEVSMVDLPLMTRVFRALKDTTKVILLGDADQLPSVAAGSVLADIAPRPHGGYSHNNEKYLTDVCQLTPNQLTKYFSNSLTSTSSSIKSSVDNKLSVDYLSFLVKSRRFDGKGGIGLIANAVINGNAKASWKLLTDSKGNGQSITQASKQKAEQDTILDEATQEKQLSLAQGELINWLAPLVKQYYKPIEFCTNVSDAFALLSQFRVLCATRQGDYGVENINEVIKGYLGKSNALHLPRQQGKNNLYHGQPIMINENDYRLGLYNGDVGIIWNVIDQEGQEHLMACFEGALEDSKESGEEGSEGTQQSKQLTQSKPIIRQIMPSRLPNFESVYAMTIHKTQGSEFTHVAMVLSQAQSDQQNDLISKQQSGSKLLSRELLYTGITRAKKQLTIAANQRVWQQGVTGQVKRHSGLGLTLA